MAWASRPTLATLISRAKGDIASRTEGSPYIQVAFERVLAYVLAGLAHGLHGHMDWLRNQLLPTTCEIEGLLAWGAFLQVERLGATQAAGSATFAGSNGTTFPDGTSLQGEDGTLFVSTTSGVVSGLEVTVAVEAVDGGVAGNLDDGGTLSLVTPIAGIDTDGAADGDISGGTDIEDTEDYRVRILENLRTPPAGGGPGDYVAWAKEIAGVTRAWEFGNRMGYGTVSVGFVMDARVDIIPLSGDVADVQDYLDSVRPLDMRAVYVVAPVDQPVNITIDLGAIDSIDIRSAVTTSLEALFAAADLETSIAQSKVSEAISIATGEVSHTINTISTLTAGTWAILTLGTITWA